MGGKTNNGLILFALCILIFIDSIGTGLILPIMPELFFNSNFGLIIGHSLISRDTLYGFSLALIPLAAFFGMPLFGSLSDQYGRRKIILIGLGCMAGAYFMATVAIIVHNVLLYLISMFFVGFFTGTYVISYASIVDMSIDAKQKIKNFRWPVLATITGYILGPSLSIIVGLPSSPPYYHFSLSVPFFIVFLLSLLNWLLLFKLFKPNEQKIKAQLRLFDKLVSVVYIFRLRCFKGLIAPIALFYFGVSFFMQSLSLYLASSYQYTPRGIGAYFSVMAFMLAISVLIVQPLLTKKYDYKKQFKSSFCMLGVTLLLQSFFSVPGQQNLIKPELMLWLITMVFYVCLPLSTLGLLTFASELSERSEQGRVMAGLRQISSLAFFISAMFIGHLARDHEQIIFMVSGVSILVAFIAVKDRLEKLE